MKVARFSSLALAAALTLPVAAHAQVTLKFDGVKTAGGDMVGAAQTGAYLANQVFPLPVGNPFDIYCIDYDHHISNGDVWGATYLTFAQATSVGINGTAANRQLGTDKAWDIRHLRVAAYLTTQFGPVGSGPADDNWDNVHGAMWSLFSNDATPNAYSAMATGLLGTVGLNATFDSQYVLVVDTRAFNNEFAAADLKQGFITNDGNVGGSSVVPEPSTYALMGAGLLAIGFARRRRRTA